VVLLVLAIVWGVLLVSWLRSRSDNTSSDSVGTFRRHLSVLERAAPARVAPANRLRNSPIGGGLGRPTYRPAAGIPGRRIGPPPRTPVLAARIPSQAALRRRQAQRRRRDVFIALLAGAFGSLALAGGLGLTIMWPVQVLFDLLLVGYVALLIRLRNLAAEREMKLTRMPPARRTPRSADSYEFGGGYGALDLNRVAN
jgi:hypothetical protein